MLKQQESNLSSISIDNKMESLINKTCLFRVKVEMYIIYISETETCFWFLVF